MKIIFFGTSEFAVFALKAFSVSSHRVLAVVTAKDKKQGRGQFVEPSPVKIFAEKSGLNVFQPETLQDKEFLRFLKEARADLFVVAAYGKILTKEILRIPLRFAVNIHASLLPAYRGAAPINWAVIKGECVSGITIFKMNEYMDKGDIILQEAVDILPADTSANLLENLSQAVGCTLIKCLSLIEKDACSFKVQDESIVSFAPKLKKEDGRINWGKPAEEIHNLIRGVQPWPGAFTFFEGKLLKVWASSIVESKESGLPGEIISADRKKGLLVQTRRNRLLITFVQLEGRKRMSVSEFILGHNIKTGVRLGENSR